MPGRPGRFEVDYLALEGAVRGAVLEDAWSAPLEDALLVRQFAARKASGIRAGRQDGGSGELADVMLLDLDPAVTGIASQPFWLRWHDKDGARVSHAPDFFARRADGSAVVVDCRLCKRRGPRDMAKFEATGQACARVGVGVPAGGRSR